MATRGCPCGNLTHPAKACTCTPSQVQKYQAKVSGPLLDRIDLHVEAPPIGYGVVNSTPAGESSAAVAGRVKAARDIQARRYRGTAVHMNAVLTPRLMREHAAPDAAGEAILRAASDRYALSARAADRVLRVSRTIADLAGAQEVGASHVAEALQYRALDRTEPS